MLNPFTNKGDKQWCRKQRNGPFGKISFIIMNPLVDNGAEAKVTLDELLVAHEKYLPQFAKKIFE